MTNSSDQTTDAAQTTAAAGSDDSGPEGDALFGRLREELNQERSHLGEQLGSLGHDESGMDFDENFADTAQVAAEEVENRTLAAQLRDQLDEVDAALGRLDDGTYGRCAVCSEAIAPARLEAVPTARWCIEHASG